MIKILHGDCKETLRLVPDACVQCCVTSPPYFGLRDYGVESQIGLEETPEAYIQKLVRVFQEVRRVLKDDGTLWLNIGDSYSGSGGNHKEHHKNDSGFQGKIGASNYKGRGNITTEGLKPKDLIGIPWMLAFALRADGWYLRQDIIWHKPNPMPESVRDRCTKAHEYIFLLSKSPKYYFDIEPIREPVKPTSGKINGAPLRGDHVLREGGRKTERREYAEIKGANRRSVWTVTTKPYKGAHFATFPPDLIEPCILAGSKPDDIILDPFGGSGTVGGVCEKHGRHSILCELNADYISIMKNRVNSISGKEVEIAII